MLPVMPKSPRHPSQVPALRYWPKLVESGWFDLARVLVDAQDLAELYADDVLKADTLQTIALWQTAHTQLAALYPRLVEAVRAKLSR